MWRTTRVGTGTWTGLETFGEPHSVLWDMKVRNGLGWLTTYLGPHYDAGPGELDVFFFNTSDGYTWQPVDVSHPVVYHGGVSEVAFEFDTDGSLWAVTRNEDGDESGFGSHLCHAPADNLALWDCPSQSNPERYDSPQMFRHEADIYLIARRDIGGPFDEGRTDLSFRERKNKYLMDYSLRPKRTALYQINKTQHRIVHLFDLPGTGDTCFPAIVQLKEHTFLVANYTSPLKYPDISWIEGQLSEEGTQLYFIRLDFVLPD